ncbi:MAG: acetyl-CoA acetyltransferase [Chloroflexi bacterium RBG_13_52_14]|nr:MAG: acetyl-CoA acetyltransferase [Chloroflexi bacterium RBG_13_52_14]
MADGIRDKVAIIGMGCTNFGEHFDRSSEELMVEACMEAIQDAGIVKKDIGAAWSGTCYEETNIGKSAITLSVALKLPFVGSTRVENWCATGSEALRGASYAVAAGAYDICLACGIEKLKDTGYGGLPQNEVQWGTVRRLVDSNQTAPGMFAMLATRYFSRYGIAPDAGKRMLAMISAKSHRNGALNPKAHLKREVTVEQIVNAPIIAWPLGLFDCCGVSDGSAAAIVCRADMAKKFRPDPVYIKSLQISASSGVEMLYDDDWTHVETTTHAAAAAYREAGIKNPRTEISMAEVHDCFSITEAVTMEDLHFSARGKVKEDIESGFFELTGSLPVQPDGGLKSFGHPVGASGLRMVYEMYKQLQGKAGPRQIKNPKFGLTHNLGGVPSVNVASIVIVGL